MALRGQARAVARRPAAADDPQPPEVAGGVARGRAVLRTAGGPPPPVHAPFAAVAAERVRLRRCAHPHCGRAAAARANVAGPRGAVRAMRVVIDTTYARRASLSGTGGYVDRLCDELSRVGGLELIDTFNARRRPS